MSVALAWITKPLAFKQSLVAWSVHTGTTPTEHDIAASTIGYWRGAGTVGTWPTLSSERAFNGSSGSFTGVHISGTNLERRRQISGFGTKPAGITITAATLGFTFGSVFGAPWIEVYLTDLTDFTDVLTYKDFSRKLATGYVADFPIALDLPKLNSYGTGNPWNIFTVTYNDRTDTYPGGNEYANMASGLLKLWY